MESPGASNAKTRLRAASYNLSRIPSSSGTASLSASRCFTRLIKSDGEDSVDIFEPKTNYFSGLSPG